MLVLVLAVATSNNHSHAPLQDVSFQHFVIIHVALRLTLSQAKALHKRLANILTNDGLCDCNYGIYLLSQLALDSYNIFRILCGRHFRDFFANSKSFQILFPLTIWPLKEATLKWKAAYNLNKGSCELIL